MVLVPKLVVGETCLTEESATGVKVSAAPPAGTAIVAVLLSGDRLPVASRATTW